MERGIAAPAIVSARERDEKQRGYRFTYTFICPLCKKTFKSDEPGEPCCSGPSETRSDHPLEIMRLLRIDRRDVNPVRAEQRAAGKLWMPWDDEQELKRDALIVVSK